MSMHNELVIRTHSERWVIPWHCDFVNLLIEKQSITAADLCFGSQQECQCFAKQLFLLALQDECLNKEPSRIASIARGLISANQSKSFSKAGTRVAE